ncbi:Uncharacterized conserved protein [Paramagnetospirillum magneticum AMB-1]|uniref:Uncharacterized conserved protein n=2 Tax=Paramagnetospirillum magneticum TaxID=84159 RepID=Q2W8X2_PARM1|nr:Uncharacterized conserved protein [Paramagnetospirillum magneticum AMB-1]
MGPSTMRGYGMLRAVLVMILILQGLSATARAEAVIFGASRLEVITQGGKRHAFAVELATTPEQLSQGLMFRRDLPAGNGMLFDFGLPRQVAMWMKNTLIPLDMLFMDRTGRVIHVEQYTVPGSLEPRGPSEPVLGVLELPAGTVRRLGLSAGDRVSHPMFERGR